MKKVYLNPQRPTHYDGAHFIVYLNARPAQYQADENSEPVEGVEYTGTMEDGGTLIEYLQTEEDAIKTHQIQLLQAKAGLEEGILSEEKQAEYMQEWADFQAFRQEAIDLVNSWDNWE